MDLSKLPGARFRRRLGVVLVAGGLCAAVGAGSESCTVYDDIIPSLRGGSNAGGSASVAGSGTVAAGNAGATSSARGGAGGASSGANGAGGAVSDGLGGMHKGGDSKGGAGATAPAEVGGHADPISDGGSGGAVTTGGGGSTAAGGGTSGGGGSAGGAPVNPLALIDDMNHQGTPGKEEIDRIDGRSGYYFSLKDSSPESGTEFGYGRIVNGDPGRSPYAMNFHGHGFGVADAGDHSGACIGFDLSAAKTADGGKPSYDASKYRGVQFWVKFGPSCSPDGGVKCQTGLTLQISDVTTDPAGGKCSKQGGATGCYNDWTATTPDPITPTWQLVKFSWEQGKSAFSQDPAWGNTADQMDPAILYTFKFKTADPALPFDYEIDDISFMTE